MVSMMESLIMILQIGFWLYFQVCSGGPIPSLVSLEMISLMTHDSPYKKDIFALKQSLT